MATVLASFAALKDHVKFKVSTDSTSIDNIVFKLHYRATFLALLACCTLVCSRQFIGEHIRCIADSGVAPHVIETFCFFTSTFTVAKHMNMSMVEDGTVPHPGVGPMGKDDPVVHHAYYQWVPFVLFFQAILFYLPHYIWRTIEGGRLKAIIAGLQFASMSLSSSEHRLKSGQVIPSKEELATKLRQIRRAVMNHLAINRSWAYSLGLCELLNIVNVISQIYLTDMFLGGAFLGLGESITGSGSFDHKMDPLDMVFPKVTKCIFHKYGPSGSIQKHDALCVMALNVVNEKIYTFLWFWFIILAIVTGLGLVWRILTMVLHSRSTTFNKYVFSMACPGKYNPWTALSVTHEYYFSDWLFLYYIAKNLDNYAFKELFQQLAEELDGRRQARYASFEEEPLTSKRN